MLWIVDYLNPHDDQVDCLIFESDSKEEVKEKARSELKDMGIPKRNIINIEHLEWLDK